MYTEFLFQGATKSNLPENIRELIGYFFDKNSVGFQGIFQKETLPDHPFFLCDRWGQIGHMCSYSFNPFVLRLKKDHILNDGTEKVFLMCNLKNYGSEIELFLDWIDPYMEFYWGHYCYEEDDKPTFFKVRR